MALRMSVEQPLWRALAGYRVLTLCYAGVGFAWSYGEFAHPVPGTVYLAALLVWTSLTLGQVSSAERCTRWFLAADLSFALVGILLTPYVDAHGQVGPTLPSIWTAAPVLAFAIKGGWRWGGASALLVGAANVAESGALTRATLHNALLVCVASVAIGYVVEVARASERTLARALQIEAATRERERLARDIHDSVLQVLAMVQRRGTAIGGEAAELGRMAGEQEVALRTLVSSGVVPQPREPREARPAQQPREEPQEAESGTSSDLRSLLAVHAGPGVSFAEPGRPVLLPPHAAGELAAAVSAALDNVRTHTCDEKGEPARAWILLEDDGDEVVVTVRDDGPGIPAGRLDEAAREGRLGVALSIRGRLGELGGSAALETVRGQGTEVEMRVPRDG